MLSNRVSLVLVTALAPAVWGSTYLATTQLLPPDRPLLAAAVRALPAGLLLLVVARQLPKRSWWWRTVVLGALNIAVFFALLFVAAYRLPGGIAAVVGAVQPLLVAGLASRWAGEHLTRRRVLTALGGLVGVALLVLRSSARLDLLGVASALGAAAAMAAGVVLTKRWGRPAPLLATTGWQLTAGGLMLAPVALLVEGPPPPHFTSANLIGFAYLSLVGTAAAYAVWFRGLQRLPATEVTLLGLLSPVVATALGWLALGQTLNPGQVLGGLIVLAALITAQLQPAPTGTVSYRHPSARPSEPGTSTRSPLRRRPRGEEGRAPTGRLRQGREQR